MTPIALKAAHSDILLEREMLGAGRISVFLYYSCLYQTFQYAIERNAVRGLLTQFQGQRFMTQCLITLLQAIERRQYCGGDA
ncbi:AraC family transcriptional regulator [Pantoea sp. S62]|nr:AraC family transcriptional regulator [Pantoea sp. S62]